ncbi:MAG: hypothetical protein RIS70_723 [Planctomycetota bacterium]
MPVLSLLPQWGPPPQDSRAHAEAASVKRPAGRSDSRSDRGSSASTQADLLSNSDTERDGVRSPAGENASVGLDTARNPAQPSGVPGIRRLPPDDVAVDREQYTAIQARLQELGVDYYVLEQLHDNDRQYRFHCRMSIPGTVVYLRPFEATSEDPIVAMEQVLMEVEEWSARRETKTSPRE